MLAAFSRFVKPGAVRIEAVATVPSLRVCAFRNPNGSRVVEVLNTGLAPVTWAGVSETAEVHLTDTNASLDVLTVLDGTVTFPSRALTTIVLR
ncbi:glycoside hydrolase family 30 beta sandwich domain-containing protein [Nonomuraea jabiensis]|uniref:glycoside hydrolase family 30 beta sandwich domain-containing protein n=1 Tax=Nonomuraea jabiensis TaxID=882448 RepID=UPI003D75E0FD